MSMLFSLMLFRFEKDGFHMAYNTPPSQEEVDRFEKDEELIRRDVDSASVAQNPNFPLVFDSLLRYICCLVKPEYSKYDWPLTSTDVLSAIGPRLGTLHLEFLQISFPICSDVVPDTLLSDLSRSDVVSRSKFWEIDIQYPVRLLPEVPGRSQTKIQDTLLYTMMSQKCNCRIRLEHHVDIKNNSIQVSVDNLICDVLPFKILPKHWKEHYIETERYFPSKIVLSVVPQYQCNDMNLFLSKSTDNPAVQISTGQSLELAFQTPKEVGIKKSSTRQCTQTLRYWEFGQLTHGLRGSFQWTLYDLPSPKEVIHSKPQKSNFFSNKSDVWYKDRYRKASSPLNENSGVVFAADEYARPLIWTINNKNMEGKTLKLKVEGSIWLTYWPNLHNTSFYHTKKLDFSEEVELQLTES